MTRNKAYGSQSKVFAFLFPAWGIDFTLSPNWDGDAGSWAVTNPPQGIQFGAVLTFMQQQVLIIQSMQKTYPCYDCRQRQPVKDF